MLNAELTKSLVALIDETLEEIEELKKSSKFEASEVSIGGPGENLNAKAPGSADENGSLGKEESEESEKEESEEEEEEEEKEEAKKAEYNKDDEDLSDVKASKKGMQVVDAEEAGLAGAPKKGALGIPKKDKPAAVKKSEESHEDLFKSYVDEKFAPIEKWMADITAKMEKIAEQPVPSKGFTSKVVPLEKSEQQPAHERLSKSEVASKLFELKKSGQPVDSLDICKADLGTDLSEIVKKYNLK